MAIGAEYFVPGPPSQYQGASWWARGPPQDGGRREKTRTSAGRCGRSADHRHAEAHAVADKKPEATSLEKVQAYVGPSIVNLQVSWSSYVWDGHNRKILKNISTDELQEFTLTSQCTGYV